MNSAKDRITPRKVKAAKAASKPSVKVDAPKVEVNAPITVDTKAFAEEIRLFAEKVVRELRERDKKVAEHTARILNVLEEQALVVKVFLEQKGPVPQIQMPTRPDDFSVEFDDENGEPVSMRIHANVQH